MALGSERPGLRLRPREMAAVNNDRPHRRRHPGDRRDRHGSRDARLDRPTIPAHRLLSLCGIRRQRRQPEGDAHGSRCRSYDRRGRVSATAGEPASNANLVRPGPSEPITCVPRSRLPWRRPGEIPETAWTTTIALLSRTVAFAFSPPPGTARETQRSCLNPRSSSFRNPCMSLHEDAKSSANTRRPSSIGRAVVL